MGLGCVMVGSACVLERLQVFAPNLSKALQQKGFGAYTKCGRESSMKPCERREQKP